MPYRVSKNCSELLEMTQTCPTKMLKIARNDPSWPEKNAQNGSKLLKVAQNCSKLSKLLKMLQKWANKCLKGCCACIYGREAKVVITWH